MSKTADGMPDLLTAGPLASNMQAPGHAAQQPIANGNSGARFGNILPAALTAVDRYEGHAMHTPGCPVSRNWQHFTAGQKTTVCAFLRLDSREQLSVGFSLGTLKTGMTLNSSS
eukprot:GHRQ01017635.1.p1 GENE.GHRQ01017635.1~~GHRQ01017635.1.p1  ORF type:complete len:114 (+),score=16.09 GHRQ01017635.1:457-798(+)